MTFSRSNMVGLVVGQDLHIRSITTGSLTSILSFVLAAGYFIGFPAIYFTSLFLTKFLSSSPILSLPAN